MKEGSKEGSKNKREEDRKIESNSSRKQVDWMTYVKTVPIE